MKLLNWLLYETHRWLGIVLGLFMTTWLFTGLVIMYATPTTQTRSQQLLHAEHLAPQPGWLSLGEAWQSSQSQRLAQAAAMKSKPADGHGGVQRQAEAGANNHALAEVISDARLIQISQQPIWLVEDGKGTRFALSALDGSIQQFSAQQALQIALHWAAQQQDAGLVQANWLETVENPIILRNQDALKPFHRIAFADGTELLISSRSGEVLHASTRFDRAFYWAGNWIHLFKPLDSLGLGHIRHDVQFWAGLFALIATLTGLIIGWLRWRPGWNGKPTYSQGRTQPYREFWFKWHFWTGLIGGSLALAWATSGFIETNPGKLFSQPTPSREELARYLGPQAPSTLLNWKPNLPQSAQGGNEIVEVAARRLGGETVLLASTRDGQRLALAETGAVTRFTDAAITDAVQRFTDEYRVGEQILLTEYDPYYYPRHHQNLIDKPLPVIRAELQDPAGTLLYIDPKDGKLLTRPLNTLCCVSSGWVSEIRGDMLRQLGNSIHKSDGLRQHLFRSTAHRA